MGVLYKTLTATCVFREYQISYGHTLLTGVNKLLTRIQ